MALNITAGKLAELVSGKLEGDASWALTGAATLSDAGERDISFLGNPKYAAQAAATKAGCVFLPAAGKPAPCSAAAKIFVEDPQFAFSRVLVMIDETRPKPARKIDALASIDPSAKLGADVSIGPFAVVGPNAVVGDGSTISAQVFVGANAKIGKDCFLHPQTVVREECVLGDRVILQPGCMIGGDGFGFSTDRKTGKHRKIPQVGNVVVEDDVEIGANVTIDRGAVGSTRIGAGSKIDNLVQLAHGVQVGKDCLIVSQVGVSGSTVLGDRVILAGQAGLIGHLRIGDGAIVMAQSGVMNDIEKGQIVFGSPCRPNREAMKLQALTGKLPEIYETLKEVKKKLGLGEKVEN